MVKSRCRAAQPSISQVLEIRDEDVRKFMETGETVRCETKCTKPREPVGRGGDQVVGQKQRTSFRCQRRPATTGRMNNNGSCSNGR